MGAKERTRAKVEAASNRKIKEDEGSYAHQKRHYRRQWQIVVFRKKVNR